MIGELEPAELQVACEIKDLKLVTLAFQSIEDPELCKVALTQLYKLIVSIKEGSSKSSQKLVDNCFIQFKSVLLSKVLPTSESQNDPQQMAKAIQILSCFPNNLAKESITTIVSNLHHGSALVREEAATFLLSVCGDFKSSKDLLPIQKV